MSNGKNQKKSGIAVWIVIASFIVLYFLGINIYDITLGPSDESDETIGTTETTTQTPEMATPSGEFDESNLNNYSIVLKVTFGDMDVIMTGDAETKVEKAIIESGEALGAEILKVGHHGSDTSSSAEFLDAVPPLYALISTKIGNKYEHPIKSTMEKLEERKIKVYRTDENGTVVATITANDVKFSTAPGDYLSGTELEEAKNK